MSLSGMIVPLTGDNAVDAMTNGYKWQLESSRTINWTISNGWNGERWASNSDAASIFDAALSTFSYFANVKFNYLGTADDPQIAYDWGSDINFSLDGRNVKFDDNYTWAIGAFPNPNDTGRGDIYFNLNSEVNKLSSYAPGSAGFFVSIHEIGHTLGLKHPHDSGGTGRPTFDSLGWSEFDKDFTTMMSYNDDYDWNRVQWDPSTPMIFDIIALQYLYGKNMSTNAGDTKHTLSDVNFYRTLWDASGNDIIDQSSASEGWHIVLPDKAFSSLVDTKFGFAVPFDQKDDDVPRTLNWLAGTIENLTGSSFDDLLEGSSYANTLRGHFGHDAIDGVLPP